MTDQQDKNWQQLEESREGLVLGIILIIVKVLTDKGVNKSASVLIAMDIINDITAELGGINFYLPKRNSIRYAERAAKIMAEFDGKNHLALGKKYGVSFAGIYQLINRENKKETRKQDVTGIAAILKSRQEGMKYA